MEKKGKGILGVLKKILKVYLFVIILGILLGVISEITGIGESKGIPENVLDYLGTKDSEVYKIYDKSEYFTLEEYHPGVLYYLDPNSELPGVSLRDGQVIGVHIYPATDSSYHVNGLRCGDSAEQIEKCMNKLKASQMSDREFPDLPGMPAYRSINYQCQYKKQDVEISISVRHGFIDQINVNPMDD